MALVFFKEAAAADTQRVGLITEDDRIPVADLANCCNADPGMLFIGGERLRVDARGLSELSWEQLKQAFNLVGSRGQPVAFTVGWTELPCESETFSHGVVSGNIFFEKLALDFRTAFREVSGQRLSELRLRLEDEKLFLAQAASFWAEDVPSSLYQGRIVVAFRQTANELRDGVEEVVSKARRRTSLCVVFGLAVACQVRRLVPLVAFPVKGGVMTVVKGRELDLDSLDGLKEVEFQIFAAVGMQLLVGSEAFTGSGEVCTLADGPSFRVAEAYAHSESRGGTYLVHKGHAKFVLKTGPTKKATKLAKAFRAYGGDWKQVESEIGVREFLARSSCNLSSLRVPQMLHAGRVAAPPEWAGCHALVMSFEGESLQSKVLSLSEVEAMGVSLLTTLATLHAHGVFHCDICPRNVAYDRENHKFCLLDFGAALYGRPAWQLTNHVTDMRYGAMGPVLWCSTVPENEWDFESLFFTMLEVAGLELPWSSAAEASHLDQVQQLRQEVLDKGGLLCDYHVQFPQVFHALERLMLGQDSVDTMLNALGISQAVQQQEQTERVHLNEHGRALGCSMA